MLKKYFCLFLSFLFISQSTLINNPLAFAESPLLSLPAGNQMIALSQPVQPVMLQGLRYDPQKPFQFQFILQQGEHSLPLDQLRDQGMGLVRYFMAAMTMSKEDLWVNLSPYEKNRIIPNTLGMTRLGSDMLVQDYILKQLASSLTFPDSKIGSNFWKKIYSETQARFGKTDVAVSTFNKVWIVPDYAEVLVKDNTVIVTDSHLKVMMEQDYLAQKKGSYGASGKNLASDVMREVIIPILEKEVNTGSHFAALRQMFHAVVLAEWYKRNLKESLFSQYYANRHKITGIDEVTEESKEAIYKRYLSAYKKGVYNFIREDTIADTGEIVPRKYFSGGENLDVTGKILEKDDFAQLSQQGKKNLQRRNAYLMDVGAFPTKISGVPGPDSAMATTPPVSQDAAEEFIRTMKTKFLADMEERWTSSNSTEPNVRQLINQLQNDMVTPPWIHIREVQAPWGEIVPIVMIRARQYGEITKGGYRAVDARQSDDVKKLLESFLALNPTIDQQDRFHLKTKIQTVFALFNGMTIKTAIRRLVFRGAKGLIFIARRTVVNGQVSYQDFTPEQFQILNNIAAYWYGYDLTKDNMVGPDIDSPAPDQNTTALQMRIATEGHIAALLEKGEQAFEWKPSYIKMLEGEKAANNFKPPVPGSYHEIYEELLAIQKDKEDNPGKYSITNTPLQARYTQYGNEHPGLPLPANATFTGKDPEDGGVEGRGPATGRGIANSVKIFSKLSGLKLKTVGMQGFGNVASWAGIYLNPEYPLTYIGERGGTLFKKGGFSDEWLKGLQALVQQRKTIPVLVEENPKFFKGVTILPENYILTAPVDILIPAATENVLTEANIDKINVSPQVKLLVEGGNDPLDNIATKILSKRGVFIVKDVFANSEGVKVSGWEMVQNLLGIRFTKKYVEDRMDREFEEEFRIFYEIWEKRNRGITNPEQQTSFPDILNEEMINQLAKDQMKLWIDEEHGELNGIRKHYDTNLGAESMLRRIMRLDLLHYLIAVQEKNLQDLRTDILKELRRKGLLDASGKLEAEINQIFSITNPIIKGKNFSETLFLARTFYRVLSGEKVTEAFRRLEALNYTIPRIKDLRRNLQLKLLTELPGVLEPNSPENRLYEFLQKQMWDLDDAPGRQPKDNPAMTAANGGIDFDTSHMLIDREGEASFKSQTKGYDLDQLQQIKGFVPVFLRMTPVDVLSFMGIN